MEMKPEYMGIRYSEASRPLGAVKCASITAEDLPGMVMLADGSKRMVAEAVRLNS
jgi:hypothetical protein